METTDVANSSRTVNDSPHDASDRDAATCRLLSEAGGLCAQQRDLLLDEAVRLNVPLADALAHRYRGRGEDEEDLVQVARLALIKAVHRFDPERGHFTSFAVPTVTGELKRHFRDRCWMVKPPRRIQEQQAPIAAAESDLAQKFGRSPSHAELMEYLGLSSEEVAAARSAQACFQADSLDAPMRSGMPNVQDRLGETDKELERVEAQVCLARAFEQLPPPDQHLLHLRFFDELTQAEIAARLETNQMAISRRLAKVIKRLADLTTLPAELRADAAAG